MARKQLRAVGYIRRSTDHQDRSLNDQRNHIIQYAQKNGLLLGEIYQDDAISGTSTRGRTSFHRLMRDASRKPSCFDLVLVYDVKRFGRMDNDETGYYRHLLRMNGVRICYTSEDFVDRFIDDLVRPVKQWQARQESRDLAKIVIRGHTSKFHSAGGGWWIAGAPPFGYDRNIIDGNGKFVCIVRRMPDCSKQILDQGGNIVRVLEPLERVILSDRDRCRLVASSDDRVAIVRRIFFECTENGLGATAIANRLNQEGIPSVRPLQPDKKHSGLWTQATVRNMLMNPTYVGDIVWNRTTCGTFYRIHQGQAIDRPLSESKTSRNNHPDDWFIVSNAHEGLVSRYMFEQAQHIISVRHKISRRSSPDYMRDESDYRSRYLLTGILECVYCHQPLWGTILKRQYFVRRRNIYSARMYCCRSCCNKTRDSHPDCKARFVRRRILEKTITDRLIKWYGEYLKHGGSERIDAAAKQEYKRMVRAAGPAGKIIDVSNQAHELAINCVSFLQTLKSSLYQKNSTQRRTAIRRCVHHVEVDLKRSLLVIFARRLPMHGGVSGGNARLVAHLPKPRGKLILGPRKRTTPKPQVFDLSWHLQDKPKSITDLALKLMALVAKVGPNVTQSIRQCYVAYSEKRHFVCIKLHQTRILLYLKLRPEHVRNKPVYMRDVTGLGTQASGKIELSIDCSTDLNVVMKLVRDSYRNVCRYKVLR